MGSREKKYINDLIESILTGFFLAIVGFHYTWIAERYLFAIVRSTNWIIIAGADFFLAIS